MRAIDEATSRDFGVPSILLMELAGKCVGDEVWRLLGDEARKKRPRVAVVCGGGANGGDGYSAARHLLNAGADVTVFRVSKEPAVGSDSRLEFDALRKLAVSVIDASNGDVTPHEAWLRTADVVVDAIFGTGLTRDVEGAHLTTIDLLNALGAKRLAVDVPSGLDADTGQPQGATVRADVTVTMGLPKRGLLLYPGAEFVGELVVADIGIPRALLESDAIKAHSLTLADAAAPIGRRDRDTNKGAYGHALVVAGSLGKTGAAILCCNAAMRSGAGLVTLATDLEAVRIVATSAVETMCATLTECNDASSAERVFARLVELCEGKRVLAIGPGIPTSSGMALVVRRVAAEIPLPVVIDADGLNLLVGNVDAIRCAKGPRVLTPHPGEMARLTGLRTAEIARDRIGVAQKFAADVRAHVVLKGARSVVAAPDGRVWVNPTGNPGMATGGTGDVLCGVLTALIAQGIEAGQAARTAVYLHGEAGDRAAARVGERGLVASDLIDEVPRVLKEWESQR